MKLQIFHLNFGSFVIVPGPQFRIGRSGGDVDLEMTWDRLVSREHGTCTASKIGLVYRDMGSANGTWWLHGERLTVEEALVEGDCLILGDTRITVVASASHGTAAGLLNVRDTIEPAIGGSAPRTADPTSLSTISLQGYLGTSEDLSHLDGTSRRKRRARPEIAEPWQPQPEGA